MKKMRVYLPVLVLILLIIHGCSYMESFMLYNDSASKVVVKYRLDKDKAIGSPLFWDEYQAYQVDDDGDVIWEKPLEIENLDPDSAEFEFILPPKTVLRFGVLSNDNYVSHDQEFMNGRVFNLKKMTVQKGESEPEVITKSSFDNYFVKDDGEIRYTVK